MAKTTWTPGPWRVFENRHPTTQGEPWGVVESKAHPAGGAGQLPAGLKVTWTGAQGRANARLISAAPEMAELLESVEQRLWSGEPRAVEIRTLLKRIRGEA